MQKPEAKVRSLANRRQVTDSKAATPWKSTRWRARAKMATKVEARAKTVGNKVIRTRIKNVTTVERKAT